MATGVHWKLIFAPVICYLIYGVFRSQVEKMNVENRHGKPTSTFTFRYNSRVADSGLARRLAERVPELHRLPHQPAWCGGDWTGWGGREETY